MLEIGKEELGSYYLMNTEFQFGEVKKQEIGHTKNIYATTEVFMYND